MTDLFCGIKRVVQQCDVMRRQFSSVSRTLNNWLGVWFQSSPRAIPYCCWTYHISTSSSIVSPHPIANWGHGHVIYVKQLWGARFGDIPYGRGSNPGRVTPKTLKVVLAAILLGIQHKGLEQQKTRGMYVVCHTHLHIYVTSLEALPCSVYLVKDRSRHCSTQVCTIAGPLSWVRCPCPASHSWKKTMGWW